MSNLDNRIANADQLLTTDIDKFCESTVDLYSNTCKPLLDVFIYIYQTTAAIGAKTPLIIMMYLMFSGAVLTHLRRPTGNLTIQEQKLEGEYRYVNSRVSHYFFMLMLLYNKLTKLFLIADNKFRRSSFLSRKYTRETYNSR